MTSISEILSSSRPCFSIEVLPPLKGTGMDKLCETVNRFMPMQPAYINITSHRSEYVYKQLPDGNFCRKQVRRRPGTVAVAAALHARFGIPTVPHLVCSGATKDEIEYTLLDLQFLGITDLLLLRGDKARHERNFTPESGGYAHAIELQRQVNEFNQGRFSDGSPIEAQGKKFSYGVACYPEKHEEAPNLEQDLLWLKQKADEGAQYAVTQLFYDNEKYFEFVRKAREIGVNIPIVPGIKPLARKAQLTIVPQTFKVDVPDALAREIIKCQDDRQVAQLGTEWAINQCRELLAKGAPGLHFYTAGSADGAEAVVKSIF